MRLETVKSCDVYEDESNPRGDFGDLEALAASFELNGGEPFNPPMVVQDGGIYRIVDGARRFRAMKLAGTEEFSAVVCDDMDEANVMIAMVATDDKKALDEVERSRGFQQMLMLGVDPDTAAKAARVREPRKVGRGMRLAGERAEELTIEHLIAVAEAASVEDAQQIAEASEKDFAKVADRMRRAREARETAADIRNVCRAHGIELLGNVVEGKQYRCCVYDAAALVDWLEVNGRPDGLALQVQEDANLGRVRAYVYSDRPEAVEDEEERRLADKVERRMAMQEECLKAVVSDLVDRWEHGDELSGHVTKLAYDRLLGVIAEEADGVLEEYGFEALCLPTDFEDLGENNATVMALTLTELGFRLERWDMRTVLGLKPSYGGVERKAARMARLLEAANEDGVELPMGWGMLREDLASYVAKCGKWE